MGKRYIDIINYLSEEDWDKLQLAIDNGLTLAHIYRKINLNKDNIGDFEEWECNDEEFGEAILGAGFEQYLKDQQEMIIYDTFSEYFSSFLKEKVAEFESVPMNMAEAISEMTSRETGEMINELKSSYNLRRLCEELKIAGIINDFNEEKL